MSEMYTCRRCGKPTPNFTPYEFGEINGKNGFSFCDDCRKKNRLEQDWKNEQFLQEEITCPWCGYEDPDSWEFGEGSCDDWECPSCGKRFAVEADVTVTYTTSRRLDDMPEGWCGDD